MEALSAARPPRAARFYPTAPTADAPTRRSRRVCGADDFDRIAARFRQAAEAFVGASRSTPGWWCSTPPRRGSR